MPTEIGKKLKTNKIKEDKQNAKTKIDTERTQGEP